MPETQMGKALTKVFRSRLRPCKHSHVSGRRCPVRITKDRLLCDLHKHGICSECHSMLGAFEPAKGWPKGTGDF